MNYFWKEMPFVRFIIPLIAGIIFQFYAGLSLQLLLIILLVAILCLIIFLRINFARRYTLRWIQGGFIHLALLVFGSILLYQKDIKHNKEWIGHIKNDSLAVMTTLQEPLVAKAKSYKAEASIESVYINGTWQKVQGKVLLYFGKDSASQPTLNYGSQVIFYKPLQEIKNSGNPGNFNYKQFNAFKDIYHQAFLKTGDYAELKTTKTNAFQQWLYDVRTIVIKKLQQFIPGDKESGVAEALLIGYRDDLDKDLVQAYSNTGVVHIIAISGLHLGMIYAVLVLFFRPFKKRQWARWLKPVVVLTVLWVFTFLAGAVPSILRSAVMFSFIVLGETIDRKSSVYNTLASSAFVMLCFNPYFLWDIGFQLSYIAVVSIVAFSKPVYNWFYVENKLIDFVWKLTSVTIAAQILTVPIIFYSFHQFPNFFLLTNCIVVPLSTIVLFAELVVLIVSPWALVAKFCGMITGFLLHFMNSFIELMSSFRFAVTDEIQVSLVETILLYIVIIFLSLWLMKKIKFALFAGLTFLFVFVVINGVEAFNVRKQQKLIVYNVPKQTSIDFIKGRHYAFVGDSVMTQDGYLRNFHLKPSRTLYKAITPGVLKNLYISRPFIQFENKRVLVVDEPFHFENDKPIKLDAIVLTKNPKVSIAALAAAFECQQYIIDGSNSLYKTNKWKRECDSLQLPCHVCSENGAFEISL